MSERTLTDILGLETASPEQSQAHAYAATRVTMSAIAAVAAGQRIGTASAGILVAISAAQALAALDRDAALTLLTATLEPGDHGMDEAAKETIDTACARLVAAHKLLHQQPGGAA